MVNSSRRGFTLIEVLVAIAILGILMGSVMAAFVSIQTMVADMNERNEVTQSLRTTSDQIQRELSTAVINNNRPDGEQVYFEIKQLGDRQSVLRFGCTTDRGLVEIGYQLYLATNGWQNCELRRMYRTERMWKYSDKKWPVLDMNAEDVEPFAPNIVAFHAEYWDSSRGGWASGTWESLGTNAMPRRVRITLMALSRSQAKEANVRGITTLKGLSAIRVESLPPIEVNLPQSK